MVWSQIRQVTMIHGYASFDIRLLGFRAREMFSNGKCYIITACFLFFLCDPLPGPYNKVFGQFRAFTPIDQLEIVVPLYADVVCVKILIYDTVYVLSSTAE